MPSEKEGETEYFCHFEQKSLKWFSDSAPQGQAYEEKEQGWDTKVRDEQVKLSNFDYSALLLLTVPLQISLD